MASKHETLRVLELYSGIGGMHWALKASHLNYEVAMAVDINTTANQIYQHNFPSSCLQSFGLEKLSLRKLESLDINTILMSPPCQPFTRVGKKGDCEDTRTKSFLHILELLQQMKKKPLYILVENVKGFETSQTRDRLVECLDSCGYAYQEFLLTPLQFGIPNSRLRYYMIANWKRPFYFEVQSQVMTTLPQTDVGLTQNKEDGFSKECHSRTTHQNSSDVSAMFVPGSCEEIDSKDLKDGFSMKQSQTESTCPSQISGEYSGHDSSQVKTNVTDSASSSASLATSCESCLKHSLTKGVDAQGDNTIPVCDLSHLRNAGRNMRYCEEEDDLITENSQPLANFMEAGSCSDFKEYWLSDRDLRLFIVMDIIFPALKKCTCFTKRYGHYIEGAGSVVQMSLDANDVQAASEFKSRAVEFKNKSQWGEEELSILRKLKLRYFTPREVANLLCFPAEFTFPDGLSAVQKYRVLGNSLNVHVVAELIKVMTSQAL